LLVYTSGIGGNFAILNPCPKKWSDLSGDDRVRYCDLCKKNVHALDEYSPGERSALWRESGGNVCGMMSKATPEPVRSRRAILLGALLTAVSPLFAQSGRLRIRVTDITGAVVPNAKVTISGTSIAASTDQAGEALITGLPIGDSRVSIQVPGFQNFEKTITVQASGEQRLEATLQIGATLGEVVVVGVQAAEPSLTPSPQALDFPVSARVPSSPQLLELPSPNPQTLKRHWWQIFH
jgi:hypothetical protein